MMMEVLRRDRLVTNLGVGVKETDDGEGPWKNVLIQALPRYFAHSMGFISLEMLWPLLSDWVG